METLTEKKSPSINWKPFLIPLLRSTHPSYSLPSTISFLLILSNYSILDSISVIFIVEWSQPIIGGVRLLYSFERYIGSFQTILGSWNVFLILLFYQINRKCWRNRCVVEFLLLFQRVVCIGVYVRCLVCIASCQTFSSFQTTFIFY